MSANTTTLFESKFQDASSALNDLSTEFTPPAEYSDLGDEQKGGRTSNWKQKFTSLFQNGRDFTAKPASGAEEQLLKTLSSLKSVDGETPEARKERLGPVCDRLGCFDFPADLPDEGAVAALERLLGPAEPEKMHVGDLFNSRLFSTSGTAAQGEKSWNVPKTLQWNITDLSGEGTGTSGGLSGEGAGTTGGATRENKCIDLLRTMHGKPLMDLSEDNQAAVADILKYVLQDVKAEKTEEEKKSYLVTKQDYVKKMSKLATENPTLTTIAEISFYAISCSFSSAFSELFGFALSLLYLSLYMYISFSISLYLYI